MLKQVLLTCAAALVAMPSLAAHEPNPTQVVGVVLAGGGAKGAAHIGVLKALEEMRIPVHVITGTSMGSYVGGLYSTGQTADQIESYLETIDWNNGYVDQVQRSDRRRRDKEYQDNFQINTDLGISLSGTKAPKGVVQGQGMLQILRQTSGNPLPVDSFDEFPIRYRAVATDIVNLEQVNLKNGYLVDAMMASMSVPGALPPYRVGEHLLVDGGVVNNMPVDVARSLGANVVIAVDISSDYLEAEELNSYFAVGGQLSNFLVQRTTDFQRSQLNEYDTYIKPNVGSIGTTDFSAMPTAYQMGYEAAYRHKTQLAQYQVSEQEFQAYLEHKRVGREQLVFGDEVYVTQVDIRNDSHFNEPLLQKRLRLEQSGTLTTEQVENSINRLYALDRFEKVTYRFEGEKDDATLVIDVTEKEWGPNYLDLRFFLEEDFSTQSQYGIGASANFTNLNAIGGELRLSGEIGTDRSIVADFYSPLLSNQLFFGNLVAIYSEEERRQVLAEGDITKLNQLENFFPVTFAKFSAEASLGIQPALWNELSLGFRYTNGDASYDFISDFGSVGFETHSIFTRFVRDTLDSFALPTKGSYFMLEYALSDDKVDETNGRDGSDENVHEFAADWIGATSFGRHTIASHANFSYIDASGNSVPPNPYVIGGFLNLSGTPRNSLIGRNKAFASLVYRYKWIENDFGLFKSPIYLGGSAEYGGVWSDPDTDFDNAPLFAAGSVFMGIDSPIGPIILAYGMAEDDMQSVYFIIGNSF